MDRDSYLAQARQWPEPKSWKDMQTSFTPGLGAVFFKVGQVQRIIDEQQNFLFNSLSLTTDSGVKEALRAQGKIEGLKVALEILMEGYGDDRASSEPGASIDGNSGVHNDYSGTSI